MNKKELWGKEVIEHPVRAKASESTSSQTDIYSSFFCLVIIIFLLFARKQISRSLMSIVRCCFRFSQTIRAEDNISLGQGRIILFSFSLFYFSVLSFYAIQTYRIDLYETYGWLLVPFLFVAFVLFYQLRWGLFMLVGWVIKQPEEFTFLAKGLRDYLILSATCTLPLSFVTLLPWSQGTKFLIFWCAIAIIISYLLFLFRTIKYFIYVRFSVFFWFLYLCSLEIAPIAFLYSALLTI